MSLEPHHRSAVELGRTLSSELAEYGVRDSEQPYVRPPAPRAVAVDERPVDEFDRRITEHALRLATHSRFVSAHYADAIEAAVKALNECVRERSGSTADGDSLMTTVFSEKNPKLRVNRMRNDSDRSEHHELALAVRADFLGT